MATKPTSATFTHATNATFGSGPAAGLQTKYAFLSPADGAIPGQAVEAEELNYNFNRCGQWSVWLDAGSSDRLDVSAHIVETNASGHAGVPKLLAGGPAWADSAVFATSDDAASATVSAQNTSGVAAEFTSVSSSAVQAYTGSATATDAGFKAIVTGAGSAGFYTSITTANSRGYYSTVNANSAFGIYVDVTGGSLATGIYSQTATAGPAVQGLTTAGGFGIHGVSSGAGTALVGQSLGAATGINAASASGVPFLCGTNATRGAMVLDVLGTNPATPTDGTFAYVSGGGANHSIRFYFDFGSGAADYLVHASRFGGFGDSDATLGVAASGVLTSPTTVCTVNAGADEMPQKAGAPAIVEFTCDVYTATSPISGTPPSIGVYLDDTTAGAVIGGASPITGCATIRQTNDIYQIVVRVPYTIPATGARNFTARIANANLGGENLQVRNPMLSIRPSAG